MNEQISFFDGSQKLKITKPIRLIELFSGYGSQSLALKYLGVPFDHWKISEWAINSIKAYKDIHFPGDDTDYSEGMSDEDVFEALRGRISSDYSNPIPDDKLRKRKDLRSIYNDMKASHNLASICGISGDDLAITETDKYTYIMTYSFPCQDLSVAGRQKGMQKDSGTRSGMLWEVERLLNETKELPQILIMENVPAILQQKFIGDFHKWMNFLERKGYRNKYKVINATDFGIPQNRELCFMVSFLGDYYYDFPDGIHLDIRLKNLLEKDVDDRYYLSMKGLKYISVREGKYTQISDGSGIAESAVTAKGNQNWTGNFIDCSCRERERERERERSVTQSEQEDAAPSTDTVGILLSNRNVKEMKNGICPTILAHLSKGMTGFKNQADPAVMELSSLTVSAKEQRRT